MTNLDEARDTATLYLWMRMQLSHSQEDKYRDRLAEMNETDTYGLDGALREAAERITQMRDE